MAVRLTQDEVPIAETWNLDDIYPSPAHWAADMTAIEQDIDAVAAFQGRLAESASVLAACLQAQEALLSRLDRLRRYAYFRLAADGISPENQSMSVRAEGLAARADAARSFIVSELAALPEGTLDRYLEQNAHLLPFRALPAEVGRRRAHLLSPETEAALAALGESMRASSVIQPLSTVATEPMALMLEAPSTANELLLAHHLLDTAPDPRFRRWVILQSLGTFTHNMVTHLLEGRFERRLYELAEAGKPLTLSVIMSVQEEVFARFYDGTIALDDGARLYWAQQPHFYMNHYSYTYAAGLAAACAGVEMMRTEGQPAVNRRLEMLELGATLPPVEILRHAGVDIAHPDTLRNAARYFGSLVDELEQSY